MDIFEWSENIPVTANNLNEMQNIINNNISEKASEITDWKLLGKTSGTATINFPSNFKEIMALVVVNKNTGLQYVFNIPKILLSSTTTYFNNGYYGSANNMTGYVRIALSTSTGNLIQAYSNQTNVLNNSDTTWYYR